MFSINTFKFIKKFYHLLKMTTMYYYFYGVLKMFLRVFKKMCIVYEKNCLSCIMIFDYILQKSLQCLLKTI